MDENATNTETSDSQSKAGGQGPSQGAGQHSPSPRESLFVGLSQRLFGKPESVRSEQAGEGEDEDKSGGEPASNGEKPGSEPEKVTLTQEELNRQLQSARDQGVAHANKLAQDRAREAQRAELKKSDPYAYIEQEDQEKAQTQATEGLIHAVAKRYDELFLDPIKGMLPKQVQDELLGKDGVVGMDGRKDFVDKAIKHLIKTAREEGAKEAEKRIRKNPALVKQVIIGERENEPDPEVNDGGSSVAPNRLDMNLILRRAAGRPV